MRPWLLVVNTIKTLNPSQSTTGLIQRILQRGHPVAVVPGDGLDTLRDGTVVARARFVDPAAASSPAELVAAVRRAPDALIDTRDVALVLVRLNPGRGPEAVHRLILDQLTDIADAGVPVLNDPRGLARARSKLYLSRFPEHARPPTLVTRSASSARAFIAELGGRAVLKPVSGTRGRDVFMVRDANDPNLNQILDVLFRSGFAMVQGFVPEASAGDTRVLLLNGELMEDDGRICAVRRVPSGSDFRSNVHVGGTPAPAEPTPALRELVAAVGPRLRADGLFLVGLDVIGNVVVEANVFSPGGFSDAEAFTGIDFLEQVVTAAEQHLR